MKLRLSRYEIRYETATRSGSDFEAARCPADALRLFCIRWEMYGLAPPTYRILRRWPLLGGCDNGGAK